MRISRMTPTLSKVRRKGSWEAHLRSSRSREKEDLGEWSMVWICQQWDTNEEAGEEGKLGRKGEEGLQLGVIVHVDDKGGNYTMQEADEKEKAEGKMEVDGDGPGGGANWRHACSTRWP
jgi:hypothetical protein